MFWIVAVIHAIWGVCLIWSPDPLGITALLVAHAFAGQHHVVLGLVYTAASALAAMRLVRGINGRRGFLLLLPQALLLTMTAMSCIYRAYIHQYADGVPRPFLFIAPDQVAYIVLAIFHTFAWITSHGEGRWTLPLRSL